MSSLHFCEMVGMHIALKFSDSHWNTGYEFAARETTYNELVQNVSYVCDYVPYAPSFNTARFS